MKCNYHTHTTRCHHAMGTDEAFVQAAVDAGYDVLGFADHAPWPYAHGFVSNMRMTMEELPDYVNSIKALQNKYAGQIQLHIGLESEYFPRYSDHLRRLLDSGTIEYLILGPHFTDSDECTPYVPPLCREDDGVKRYAEHCVTAMETGLFRYIAHPDLYLRYRGPEQFNPVCQDAARDIAVCARAQGMAMEYNLLGLLNQMRGMGCGYPSECFWRAVKPYAGDVILGVDAHEPEHLLNASTWERGTAFLTELGYTPIDHLTLKGGL